MVTKRSSVDPMAAPGGPKVAVRAAEKRGYRVPMEQKGRSGRTPAGRGGASGTALAERRRPRWRQRLATTLDLIRANPTGRVTLKIFIAIAG
ncbi:TIGR02611 family protein, partial [Micromonospora sp. NPDC000018]